MVNPSFYGCRRYEGDEIDGEIHGRFMSDMTMPCFGGYVVGGDFIMHLSCSVGDYYALNRVDEFSVRTCKSAEMYHELRLALLTSKTDRVFFTDRPRDRMAKKVGILAAPDETCEWRRECFDGRGGRVVAFVRKCGGETPLDGLRFDFKFCPWCGKKMLYR